VKYFFRRLSDLLFKYPFKGASMKAKTILFLFFVVILYRSLSAQIPGTISFQGVLTDTSGIPKPDGVYLLTFRLYETPAGGSPVWSEQNSISVDKGLFSHSLGSINTFSPSVEFDKPYWLTIEISGESELTPRIPLTSSPYSFSSVRSRFADTSFVAVTTISDTLWQTSGLNIFRLNGNVGLGKIPSSKLDVDGTIKGTTLQMTTGSGNGKFLLSSDNDGLAGWSNRLLQNSSNIVILGSLGINDSTPRAPLHIVNSLTGFNPIATRNAIFENNGGVNLALRSNETGRMEIFFERPVGFSGASIRLQDSTLIFSRFRYTSNNTTTSSSRFYMDLVNSRFGIGRVPEANALEVGGNASKSTAGEWLANSDIRIKTDIKDITDAKSLLMKLHPVKFRYTDEWRKRNPSIKDHYFYNFIAQEFKEVFPNSVAGSGEYLDGDPEEILQIDTYNAGIITIKAVQELIKENDDLKKEIKALYVELNELKKEINNKYFQVREAKR
jgi:hypothetical protein